MCCNRNSILYLPTGSGKTFIALKVIDYFRDDLKQPLAFGGKRSVFLVNTVCLANQHTETIDEMLGLDVACWTSETKKKSWNRDRFREEFERHQVIVATVQLFVDAIKHSFVDISEINVLVLDECHHARADHPYHELMKQFKYSDPTKHPRIIGLSGMLIGIATITVDNVEETLKALEATLMSKIVTVRKIEEYANVLLHSTNPIENFVRFDGSVDGCDDELTDDLIAKIDEIRWSLGMVKINGMQEINPRSLNLSKSRKLKELSLLFEHVKVELQKMGLFAAYLCLQGIKVQYGLIKKKPNQNREFLKQVDCCIEHVNELLDMLKVLDFEHLTQQKLIVNSSEAVRKLIVLLKLSFNNPDRKKDLQSLIFVTQRNTAKILYHLLKKYADLDCNFPIKPDFVVGINAELPESISEIDRANENKDAIEKFRAKKTNVIATTSVLEEGIDLQMCNLVIMFDHPTTFRAYVQSKGRARVRDSSYIVMVENAQAESFLRKRDKYSELDLKMKKILLTKACDGEVDQEDIDKEQVEIWEPYFTQKKAVVNNLSAVALLNRFVSPYANANRLWAKHDVGGGKVLAILTLPACLGFKAPIISDAFDDIKTAKQSAAFKACEMLHQKGLLDHHLLPK